MHTGIVISNHGGNIIEHSLSPCEVIEYIRKEVGASLKYFVDGAVRSGEDVFKLLALGADAVSIGRPYCISVYGGGCEGVKIYTNMIRWQLQNVMRLTDCRALKDITRDKIAIVQL